MICTIIRTHLAIIVISKSKGKPERPGVLEVQWSALERGVLGVGGDFCLESAAGTHQVQQQSQSDLSVTELL